MGLDTRVAEMVDPNVFVPLEIIDGEHQSSSESLKTTNFEDDGSPAADDAASKYPVPEELKTLCNICFLCNVCAEKLYV